MATYKDHCYAVFFQHRCNNPVWKHKGLHTCRDCSGEWNDEGTPISEDLEQARKEVDEHD